jgi:hypothetical protein
LVINSSLISCLLDVLINTFVNEATDDMARDYVYFMTVRTKRREDFTILLFVQTFP